MCAGSAGAVLTKDKLRDGEFSVAVEGRYAESLEKSAILLDDDSTDSSDSLAAPDTRSRHVSDFLAAETLSCGIQSLEPTIGSGSRLV